MIKTVRVSGEAGARIFQVNDFPLSVGVGTDAVLQLPGLEEEGVVAFLGLTDGAPFIQPLGLRELYLNNERIKASRWLYDGDSIYIGNARIICLFGEEQLELRIQRLRDEPPPELELTAAGAMTEDGGIPEVESGMLRWKRRKRLLLIAISLGFGVLLLLAGFVFTAKSVAVRIKPVPDSQSLSGGLLHLKLASRYLLRPGDYELVAEKEGYQVLRESFSVSREQNQMVTFTMQPLPGYLTLSLPSGVEAEVTVDGEAIDRPASEPIALSEGTHTIAIQAEHYVPLQQEVLIEGEGQHQTLVVELIPLWAGVAVSSEPSAATVLVDGVEQGETPLTLELAAGTHRLEIKLPGYELWQRELVVEPNQAQTLPPAVLKKADGRVLISSEPPGASVSVDDVFQGQTPIEVAITSGHSHEVSLAKAGYQSATTSVKVDAGEKKELLLKLEARRGVVIVQVEPADTTLYVDGAVVPVGDGKLQLSAIEHLLEFKKSGYQSYRTRITPRPGLAQEVLVTLQPSQQSKKAPPVLIRSAAGQSLRYIPPGRFGMGSSRREQGRRANETLHPVQLSRAFYLAVQEVTNADFRAFKPQHHSGGVQRYSLDDPLQPVVGISWEEAAAYCNWLSQKDSLPPAYVKHGGRLVASEPLTVGYRLPTEAEWVWATRYDGGETAKKYAWGERFPPSAASGNYADSSAVGLVPGALTTYTDRYPVTAPVASFSPNRLGFYDLDGNVAEWMHDFYTIYPSANAPVLQDPTGPRQGTHHVIRGASWQHGSITELRLAYRDYGQKPRIDLGFRIARYAR